MDWTGFWLFMGVLWGAVAISGLVEVVKQRFEYKKKFEHTLNALRRYKKENEWLRNYIEVVMHDEKTAN